MNRTWTDEQLVEAVAASKTIKETALNIGLKPRDGTYNTLYRHIDRMQLDVSHWSKCAWRDGRPGDKTVDQLLAELEPGVQIPDPIKWRIVKEGLMDYSCAECGTSEWRGRELILQLHHIVARVDGGSHELSNLQLLCPNCHSQTTTDRLREKARGIEEKIPKAAKYVRRQCKVCGKQIYNATTNVCYDCYREEQRLKSTVRCRLCGVRTYSKDQICRRCKKERRVM